MIPLTSLTAVLTLIAIYNLRVNDRVITQVTDREPVFSNTGLLTILLAFIDLQRLIFNIILYFVMKGTNFEVSKVTPAD